MFRGRTVSMNMLRIVLPKVVFGVVVFIFPVFLCCVQNLHSPFKAVVEFKVYINYYLQNKHTKSLATITIWVFRQFRHTGTLKGENHPPSPIDLEFRSILAVGAQLTGLCAVFSAWIYLF